MGKENRKLQENVGKMKEHGKNVALGAKNTKQEENKENGVPKENNVLSATDKNSRTRTPGRRNLEKDFPRSKVQSYIFFNHPYQLF